MRLLRGIRTVALIVVATLFLLGSVAVPGPGSILQALGAPTNKVILFSSDGMRPDLMQRYSDAGVMPTYAGLRRAGVEGANGLIQGFPPNTGVGWYTLTTGTWPGEHGSTNNTFHRTGDSSFNNSTSFSTPGILQADTLAAAAERAGKKVAQVEWVGGRNANIIGPTVDFATFFSTRGVLTTPLVPREQAGAAAFGISYQVAAFGSAGGWSNVPTGDSLVAPPLQTTLTVATTVAAQNPTRIYDVYVYDSIMDGTGAYDHVILVRSSAAKDGAQAAVDLAAGDFQEVKLTGSDGLIGARAGQTAGFYVKLIRLAGSASAVSDFKLYFTSVERLIATCGTAACAALPGGSLETYLANTLPTAVSADFAPLEARIIDEETYVQQGRDLEAAYGDAVLQYILGTLQPDTQVALVGYPVTDEFSHQFMALVTPSDMDGTPNPYYDDVEGDGISDGRIAVREAYLQSAYQGADAKLALALSLLGSGATVFATSDHGFAPQWLAVNARKVLFDAQFNYTSLHGSGGSTASNCRAAATDLTKACWAGGTVQIYVNQTLPSGITHEQVRAAAANAFSYLSDPGNPTRHVIGAVFMKEDLRDVQGSDSLHPNRSGDVVAVLRPPYQFDAATPGQRIAFSQFFGQHGYLPNLVDIAHNVDMHGTFLASGPGIRHQEPVSAVRAIDLAPTIAFLLGIPGPQNARGKVLYQLLPQPDRYKEITILSISDFRGQLAPLSEAADTVSPSFGIGGETALKGWLDAYRAEARDGSITVAVGNSVLAGSSSDTLTIQRMNAMGFSADGLGEENFAAGQDYLRHELIPVARFHYLTANILNAAGDTPPEWSKSRVFTFGSLKVGVIGFSNTGIAPALLGPFHIDDPLQAVSKRADQLLRRSATAAVDAIVAIGHLGATDATSPSGPLIDLANSVPVVATVIGGQTDVQVISTRPNGVLVVENRSQGIRFTRIRLVFDMNTKTVIYKTADFHKPWGIGIH